MRDIAALRTREVREFVKQTWKVSALTVLATLSAISLTYMPVMNTRAFHQTRDLIDSFFFYYSMFVAALYSAPRALILGAPEHETNDSIVRTMVMAHIFILVVVAYWLFHLLPLPAVDRRALWDSTQSKVITPARRWAVWAAQWLLLAVIAQLVASSPPVAALSRWLWEGTP